MTLSSRSNRTSQSQFQFQFQTQQQQQQQQQQQNLSSPQRQKQFFSSNSSSTQKGDDAKYGSSTCTSNTVIYSQNVLAFVRGGIRGSILPFASSYLLDLYGSSSSRKVAWYFTFLVFLGMTIPNFRLVTFTCRLPSSLQRPGKNIIGWWITTTLLSWSCSTDTSFFGWRMVQLFLCSYGSSDTHNSTTYRAWLAGFTLSVFLNGVLFWVFHDLSWLYPSNIFLWFLKIITLFTFGITTEYMLRRLSIITTTSSSSSSNNHTSNNTSNRHTVTLRARTMTEDENFYDCASDWDDVDDHEYQYSTTDPEMGYTADTPTYDHQNFTDQYDIDEDTYPHYQSNQLGIYDSDKGICKLKNENADADADADGDQVVPACVAHGQIANVTPQSFESYYGQRKALDRWEQTKRWRIQNNVYKIHSLPHIHFDAIKQAYFHVIHGKDKNGFPVIYERPGTMNLKDLFNNQGVVVQDMITHYTYFMEFLSNVVCSEKPNGEWGFTVVMDVKGASIRMLSGDVLKYLKQAGEVNAAHYPCSMKMVLCANSPFWLASAFGTLKGILPANTAMEVMSTSNQIDILSQYINIDQIPKEYGGKSPHPLDQHPLELQLAQTVKRGLTQKTPQRKHQLDLHPSTTATPQTITTDDDFLVTSKQQEENTNSNLVLRTPRQSSPKSINNITPPTSNKTIVPLAAPVEPLRERSLSLSSTSSLLPSHSGQHNISLSWRHPNSSRKKRNDLSLEILLGLISSMHVALFVVQGGLEVFIPLWFTIRLKYGPSQCGIVLFSIGVVLLWATRTKVYKKFYIKFTSAAPMHAYRIGVALSCILLFLFPSSSSSGTDPPSTMAPTSAHQQDYNMLGMTCAIIVLTCLFVFLMMARMASHCLHQTASAIFIDKLSLSCDDVTMVGRALTSIAHGIHNGRFTSMLSLYGEVLGAFLAAFMYEVCYPDLHVPFLVASYMCGF